MSQALYRKYRSKTLDDVLGQDHVTGILKAALKKGKIAHAYLLTGPRGTGKTSVARILAHEINKLPYTDDATHLDIIEIDAASNNGVDDIRNLREKARIAPVSATYKIYIIDEVHMLSKPAFNALLKTLEEPPEHVLFILATTDADKLPATILSRVQQYHFHPISASVIAQHLQSIAKQEGFDMTPEAAELIAQHSRGGFRDSISLLDQLSSLADKKTPLDREHVRMSLGLSDEEHIDTLIHAYDAGDSSNILETLHALEEQGASPLIVTSQLLSALRKKLADAPHYVSLIQELIEVTKHPHPDLRLVTALLPPAPRAQTSAPAPAREASLKPKDKEPRPSEPEPEKPASKTKVTPAEPTPPAPKKTAGNAPVTLDWQAVLDKTKEQSLGLFSLVSRCDHEYTDGVVTIYAGSSFTWKKLDDAKNRSMIHELIQTIADSVEIVIKNGKKPSADERIRAVTAIMGGGEEVKLEDDA